MSEKIMPSDCAQSGSDMSAGQQYNAPLRPHTFDGIQEFDNKLPNWWLWTFFGAIIFSVGYWFHYEVFHTGPDQIQAYEKEVKKAEALQDKLAAQNLDLTDAGLQKLVADPEAVARGKAVFMQNCASCHKPDASGLTGPNLTDDYWLHGAKPSQIFKTVYEGVPAKGMQSWRPVLGPSRCAEVSVYLVSIRGTNKPGKKAEGVLDKGQ